MKPSLPFPSHPPTLQHTHWRTPPEWRYVVGADTFEMLYLNLTLPNNNGTWPEDLGGPLYPPERSKLSLQFQAQLKADCPDCPYMPDHESGADAVAAAAIPSEAYLFAPMWLVTSWWHRGRLGLWDPKMTHGHKPSSVLGHVHWVQVRGVPLHYWVQVRGAPCAVHDAGREAIGHFQ